MGSNKQLDKDFRGQLISAMLVSVLPVWSESCHMVLTHISQLQIGRPQRRTKERTSFISALLTGVMHGVLFTDKPLLPGTDRKGNTLQIFPLSTASVFNITSLIFTDDSCF